MTYQETVTWMFNQLPMYQMQGAKALKHKLDNILLLSARLGNHINNLNVYMLLALTEKDPLVICLHPFYKKKGIR